MSSGAGVLAAQIVLNAAADAVVTGSLEPNTLNVLAAAADFKVYLGASGTVREALQQFKESWLQDVSKPATDRQGGGIGGGNATAADRGLRRGRRLGRRRECGGKELDPIGEYVCLACGTRVPHQERVQGKERQWWPMKSASPIGVEARKRWRFYQFSNRH
jgi:hypothetical protein